MDERLISAGGICAPVYLHAGFHPKPGDVVHFTETVRVKNPLRRAWFRLTGWSVEWTVEYEFVHVPLHELLPSFTAARGGISLESRPH